MVANPAEICDRRPSGTVVHTVLHTTAAADRSGTKAPVSSIFSTRYARQAFIPIGKLRANDENFGWLNLPYQIPKGHGSKESTKRLAHASAYATEKGQECPGGPLEHTKITMPQLLPATTNHCDSGRRAENKQQDGKPL